MSLQATMGDYQTKRTLETFSFLPPLSQQEIYDQIAYIIAQGLTPAIEHVHPSDSMRDYWTMWKLPFFGEQDLGNVAAELEACHRCLSGSSCAPDSATTATPRARAPASWSSTAAPSARAERCLRQRGRGR